jgi:DNA-binding XRE family transcriptional regulator
MEHAQRRYEDEWRGAHENGTQALRGGVEMKTKSSSRAVLRKRAGLTQHRLSKITGIPSATISLWENNEVDLGVKKVERIAQAIAKELSQAPAIYTADELTHVLTLAKPAGMAA